MCTTTGALGKTRLPQQMVSMVHLSPCRQIIAVESACHCREWDWSRFSTLLRQVTCGFSRPVVADVIQIRTASHSIVFIASCSYLSQASPHATLSSHRLQIGKHRCPRSSSLFHSVPWPCRTCGAALRAKETLRPLPESVSP